MVVYNCACILAAVYVTIDITRLFTIQIFLQVVRSRDGETIYLGTETIVMRTGLLVTKAEYESSRHRPVIITGRVEFFNTTTVNTDASRLSDTGNDEVDSNI